jgi:hypothetical protein
LKNQRSGIQNHISDGHRTFGDFKIAKYRSMQHMKTAISIYLIMHTEERRFKTLKSKNIF